MTCTIVFVKIQPSLANDIKTFFNRLGEKSHLVQKDNFIIINCKLTLCIFKLIFSSEENGVSNGTLTESPIMNGDNGATESAKKKKKKKKNKESAEADD